jgi:exoribonuclease R
MAAADRRAGAVERACRDAVEAAVLAGRVGEVFRAVVVEVEDGPDRPPRGSVQLTDPAVLAPVDGAVPLGEEVEVRLAKADPVRRVVRFVLA